MHGLDSLLLAQYPNGGWYVLWRKRPEPRSPAEYPVVKASYPQDWPRSPSGYIERPAICYIINDNLVPDVVRTLLDAWDIYRDQRYLESAKKGGDFLLLAQMPEPQPAWAQQYDRNMQPIWGRKFEPPAISGAESQSVLEALLMLYRRTGESRFLEPLPRALAYFKKSLLPDGRLARFYELKTNRPLFFTKDYWLTYDSNDVPGHYQFIWESRLDAIEGEYRRLLQAKLADLRAAEQQPVPQQLAAQVKTIVQSMDERGAWVEKGRLRFHNIEPASGVINCQTFANNIRTLCRFLATNKSE